MRGACRKRLGCCDNGVGPAAALSRSGPGAGGRPPSPAHAAESAALRPAAQRPLGECPGRGASPSSAGARRVAGWSRSCRLLFRCCFPPSSPPLPPPRYPSPSPGILMGRSFRPGFWVKGLAPEWLLPVLCVHYPGSCPCTLAGGGSRRPPPPPSPPPFWRSCRKGHFVKGPECSEAL